MKGLLFLLVILLASCQREQGVYVCKPCNLACDDRTFPRPGTCPHCGMDLLKQTDLHTPAMTTGSGFFQLPDERITLFYHKPRTFRPDSDILLVVPGSGRSAESYRDAWVEASEAQGLLVVALLYPERFYSFEDYHLGGLVRESNLMEVVKMAEGSHIARLDEARLELQIQPDSAQWRFGDFDRIFQRVKEASGSTQEQYHLFGHSAGGHVLHRLALFGGSTQVGKIFACNPSFYTLPDAEVDFPFGLSNAPLGPGELCPAFERELILFLGEQDNARETQGIFLRSPTADEQGLHRLARGNHFFRRAREIAEQRDCPFRWSKVVVPGVGHDYRLMGQAVAKYLTEQQGR